MRGTSHLSAEVIVVGAGLIGLTAAAALAERGVSVTLIGEHRPGEASPAAAGMLAPSVERASGPAHDFGVAARDRYPSYVEFLADRTGVAVPLNRLGILQVALSEKGIRGLRRTALETGIWLDSKELHEIEPALSHALGAMLNPDDGAVDNVVLLDALRRLVSTSERIDIVQDGVTTIEAGADSCSVVTRSGASHRAHRLVLAAGAWVGQMSGSRFAGAVTPARGQLVSYSSSPLRHVAYGPRGYVVPRGDRTVGGTTMENVGFDADTTTEGIRKVRAASEEICPRLAGAGETRAWAGLRPVTPDMLPILGIDSGRPSLIYACGHSRNGVLMAPLTGDIIADLVTGTPLSHDLSQFRPDRF
ncbi:MAG TPA: FAD-dependent oxidoreductase [Gemmatimonadaceae bacterium]|nr:FAD-dependent oxidoreductase [Gemmatimonadaceae bacterium]